MSLLKRTKGAFVAQEEEEAPAAVETTAEEKGKEESEGLKKARKKAVGNSKKRRGLVVTTRGLPRSRPVATRTLSRSLPDGDEQEKVEAPAIEASASTKIGVSVRKSRRRRPSTFNVTGCTTCG